MYQARIVTPDVHMVGRQLEEIADLKARVEEAVGIISDGQSKRSRAAALNQ